MARKTKKDEILAAAIQLAEQSRWEQVHLHHIADELDISLTQIHQHYREKDDIADAWFDKADKAMLKISQQKSFQKHSTQEQIHMLIMGWLNTLAKHRSLTRQIIMDKLEPMHLYVKVPAIKRIHRTIQWMREAAHLDAIFIDRALEETALSTIFVATFIYWLNDDSPQQINTSRFLHECLANANHAKIYFDHWVIGPVKLFFESLKSFKVFH